MLLVLTCLGAVILEASNLDARRPQLVVCLRHHRINFKLSYEVRSLISD